MQTGVRWLPTIANKDWRRRNLVKQHWAERLTLKSLLKNQSIPEQSRMMLQIRLSKLPRDSSPTRIKNRCNFTGHARGVLSYFKLNRMALKILHKDGEVPGLTPSSW